MPKDSKHNKWHPLPPDYGTLTKDGQREARLALLRKQDTPSDLVTAWDFFRNAYLRPMGEGFYPGGFMPSPPFHYQAVYDLGAHARNALAAPRGTAKSTVIATEVPLLLALTRNHYHITVALASDKLVKERFDKIMMQVVENPLIAEDFGKLKPTRGQGIWNRNQLHLKNGSQLNGVSVMGKKRGARPSLFILDDPEFDPESDSQTSAISLLEKFEKILFRQVIPMLKFGCSIFWVGTMINKKSFLYHACTSDEDPRFKYWNRRVLTAIEYDTEGKSSLLWEELWPQSVLEARKEEIGASAFAAEYENNPSSDDEKMLVIDPTKNEYTVEEDETYNTTPLISEATTRFVELSKDGTEEGKKEKFCDLTSRMYRILTFDYSQGNSRYGDFSCAAVMGFDRLNTLWLLDLWLGKAKEEALLNKIYEMGLKWRCKVLGIEAESIQVAFADSVMEHVTFRNENEGDMWIPRVVPIKYPRRSTSSKPERIAAMEWRFRRGKIKYPRHLKHKAVWAQLYAQTQDFTKDMALLRYDDAIDAVAMHQYVIHNRGTFWADEPTPLTLADRIRQNKPMAPGLPIITANDLNRIDEDTMGALLDKAYKLKDNRRRVLRRTPPRHRRR